MCLSANSVMFSLQNNTCMCYTGTVTFRLILFFKQGIIIAYIAVPVCPVPQITKDQSNSSNCITSDRCQVGTTLQYSCESGFVLLSPTTKCLEDHTWSNSPTCGEYFYYVALSLSANMIRH